MSVGIMEHRFRNVFEIWNEGGRRVPFRVRNVGWARWRVLTIVRVSDVHQTDTGLYGRAWTFESWYVSRGGCSKAGEKVVGSAGSYQWIEVKKKDSQDKPGRDFLSRSIPEHGGV